MTVRYFILFLSALFLMAACGCSSSPRVSFYLLPSPEDVAPAMAGGGAIPCPVSVATVSIPEVLDRPQLVVRSGQSRVEVLESHRWGEPLQSGVRRYLQESLERRMSSRAETTPSSSEVSISVDIRKLQAASGGGVTLEALWRIANGGRIIRSGRFAARQASGPGYDALVSAHAAVLERLVEMLDRELKDIIRSDGANLCGK